MAIPLVKFSIKDVKMTKKQNKKNNVKQMATLPIFSTL